MFEIVTGIATKPGLSGNMLPNIKTCENESSNFSENLRVRVVVLNCSSEFNLHHKTYQFTLILCDVEVRCDVDIFKLNARAQPIDRQVHGYICKYENREITKHVQQNMINLNGKVITFSYIPLE